MKTTKQITILILFAILSFSCGEDKITKSEDEDVINEITMATDYLFQENSIYTYFVEQGSKQFEHKQENEIETFEYYIKGNLKYIEYARIFNFNNIKNSIQCAENKRLFSVFRNGIDSVTETQYEILKLNEDSWITSEIDYVDENSKYNYKEVATRLYPNVSFSLGNTNVKCIRVKYNTYSLIESKINPSESKTDSNTYHNSFEEVKTIWYAKDIGFVKEYSEKVELRGNFPNLDTMYYKDRRTLTKIEKKVSP